MVAFPFSKTRVRHDPLNPNQLRLDDNVLSEIIEPQFKSALVKLILRSYRSGMVIEPTEEMIKEKTSIMKQMEQMYEDLQKML